MGLDFIVDIILAYHPADIQQFWVGMYEELRPFGGPPSSSPLNGCWKVFNHYGVWKGDIDRNRQINMQDALIILQYLWNAGGLDSWQQWAARINSTNYTVIDAWDAQLVFQYAIDQWGVVPPPGPCGNLCQNIIDLAIQQGYPQATIYIWASDLGDGVLLDGGTAYPAPRRVVAKETALGQNYPNPFNPETWIPYKLSEEADVSIRIYNATGQLVRKLDLGHRLAGSYTDKKVSAYWDGQNETGEQVSSGVYFYAIRAGDFAATRKMIVVK